MRYSSALTEWPVSELSGVGEKIAAALQRAGIFTAWDLLLQLPLRYEDRTQITPLRQVQENQMVLICGVIVHAEVVVRRRRMLVVCLADDQTQILLRFFRFYPTQQRLFQAGVRLQCYGQVRRVGWQCEMIHPDYQVIQDETPLMLETFLTPIYPRIKGVPANLLKTAIRALLSYLPAEDILPLAIRERFQLLPLYPALRGVHEIRATEAECVFARREALLDRLKFDELLAHQLSLHCLRANCRQVAAPVFQASPAQVATFKAALPFALTNAQTRVVQEIYQDLAKPVPMMRLVQGDVGSGKTLVAALAALPVLAAGFQVVMMAPTEILAEQHFLTFKQWFEKLGYPVGFLAAKLKAKAKREVLLAIAAGEVRVIVGTHAVFQKNVAFLQLGLMIVDEQHRFGVHQRLLLRDKGSLADRHPHQLIMTATPIPRTLAMCAYADLDHSVIDELPPERQAILTIALSNQRRDEVIARMQKIYAEGQQVYWVCTLIETSEVLQCEAAEKTYADLSHYFPKNRIALIHGRLSALEKEAVMQGFVRGETAILVATTVIEVGVDVPNASLMVIENAERLGLSQLHQLRGRIGRGSAQSYCVLLYRAPLGKIARERIQVLRASQDGFRIAEKDLVLRGPGELLGTRQTGEVMLRFVDFVKDQLLFSKMDEALAMLSTEAQASRDLLAHWQQHKVRYAGV